MLKPQTSINDMYTMAMEKIIRGAVEPLEKNSFINNNQHWLEMVNLVSNLLECYNKAIKVRQEREG